MRNLKKTKRTKIFVGLDGVKWCCKNPQIFVKLCKFSTWLDYTSASHKEITNYNLDIKRKETAKLTRFFSIVQLFLSFWNVEKGFAAETTMQIRRTTIVCNRRISNYTFFLVFSRLTEMFNIHPKFCENESPYV